MAIQFYCSSCSKAIEVDDEYANRAVTCPYCRTAVTTPSASDDSIARSNETAGEFRAEAEPSGSGASMGQVPPLPGSPAWTGAPVAPAGNALGWLSLAGVTFTLVTFSIIGGFVLTIVRDMDPAIQSDTVAMQKYMQESLEARPGLQMLSMLGSCVVPVTAVICALASLSRRRQPKWPAITTLVVYFVCLLCLGFGLLVSASQLTGAPAP